MLFLSGGEVPYENWPGYTPFFLNVDHGNSLSENLKRNPDKLQY